VTEGPNFDLVLTPPARRAIEHKLPDAVAAAVIDFLTTALIGNPRGVGKPLRDDLAGIWSARRGTYRILYRINEQAHEVVILRVEHRRDAYRPL
jgi:mRNA-degrading endonuclease RelE of RelBE toxin-antitoxin system